jgi:hypothetical protein
MIAQARRMTSAISSSVDIVNTASVTPKRRASSCAIQRFERASPCGGTTSAARCM